jgi:ABC-2 type transport system ATP-binding protein
LRGAGKTTAIRILTTLARPTSGRARVAGYDVVSEAGWVRARIGLAGQAATVDGLLSARANLEMIGRLYHLPRLEARARADQLLERVALADVADKLLKNFSGGMGRRLDLAASLVAEPPVLFLDEPTTGLDPQSRNDLWKLIRERVRDGTTLILTTQTLDEADREADHIVVLDHGTVVATGTPAELKARIGGERVVVSLVAADQLATAVGALSRFADGSIARDAEQREFVVPVRRGTPLIELVRALDDAGVDALDIHRRELTLDDAFLALTGRARTDGQETVPQ